MTAIETPAESVGIAAPAAARGGGLRRTAVHIVRLTRLRQCAKNLLTVPLALALAPVWTLGALARTGWAVLAFTLSSSMIYILNDIYDRNLDRFHPVKRHRPIASGQVPVAAAALLAAGFGTALLLIVAHVAVAWWPIGAYTVLNVAYTVGLKHVPLLDVSIVAAGFVLRVAQGFAAVDTAASDLLLVAVFSGCLTLVLGKRRHELDIGTTHRPALAGYTVELLDLLLGLTMALTTGAFLIYLDTAAPLGPGREIVFLTSVPLALLGAFRFLQMVLVDRLGGDPVRELLRDRLIICAAAVIGIAVTAALVTAHYPHLLTK
jgi:4-hydroxybenzoate polyprenyltransferase